MSIQLQRRTIWRQGFWRLLLLIALLATACGASGTGGQAGGNPQTGGSINDGMYEDPSTLLPGVAGDVFAGQVVTAIWAPLLYSDDHLTIQPGLATAVPDVSA